MNGPTKGHAFALGISHTPWVTDRVESMQRLRRDLGVVVPGGGGAPQIPGLTAYREFSERCPNWVWSGDMWRWAAETSATHCLFLQDDDLVAPNFWPVLSALIESVPDEVISLYNGHPATMTLARDGERWYTTADGLVGQAYVLPRRLLEEFLLWRHYEVGALALSHIDEDTLLDVWAVHQGRRVWHPVVTVYDHDLSLPSNFGNDHHEYRGPTVTWKDADILGFSASDLEHPAWWRGDSDGRITPQHLGRFYRSLHWLAHQYTRSGMTAQRLKECDADACPVRYKRFFTR